RGPGGRVRRFGRMSDATVVELWTRGMGIGVLAHNLGLRRAHVRRLLRGLIGARRMRQMEAEGAGDGRITEVPPGMLRYSDESAGAWAAVRRNYGDRNEADF